VVQNTQVSLMFWNPLIKKRALKERLDYQYFWKLLSLPRGLFCSVTYKITKIRSRHLKKGTEIVLRNMM